MNLKRIFAILLAALTLLAAASCLGSCRKNTDSADTTGEADTSVSTEAASTTGAAVTQNDTVLTVPAALEDIQAFDIKDIAVTGWELSSEAVKSKVMSKAELDAALKKAGGTLELIFTGEKSVQLKNGSDALEGTYEITNNRRLIHAVFTGYEYYAVMSVEDSTPLLIIASTDAPNTALYLTPSTN